MKKFVIIVISIILFLFPYIFYLIDKYQVISNFNTYKKILENNIENYDTLIKELINIKSPDGYVVENDKLYYKGTILEIKNVFEGYNVINLSNNKYELFYIINSKIYKIPKIKSNFIIFDSNNRIISESDFAKDVSEIFPNVDQNITFFRGKKVYYEKISFEKGLNAIVYVKIPNQHLLLYLLFIPLGFLLLLEFEIIKAVKISKKKGDQ